MNLHHCLTYFVNHFKSSNDIVTEMALNGTTKYRISSDPPLNSCIDRLFGIRDDMCVSGGVKDFLCSYGGETRDDSSSSPVRTREEWPGERGVAWRGSDAKGRSFWSVSRLREARNEGKK